MILELYEYGRLMFGNGQVIGYNTNYYNEIKRLIWSSVKTSKELTNPYNPNMPYAGESNERRFFSLQ